eukprot:scaffold385439_cov35-Prasinocladus_malaysianus.AAC.1
MKPNKKDRDELASLYPKIAFNGLRRSTLRLRESILSKSFALYPAGLTKDGFSRLSLSGNVGIVHIFFPLKGTMQSDVVASSRLRVG